jgi:hypothetical protein
VHSGEGARAGTLLLERVARAVGALGAGKNAARSQDQDVAVRELLLQLTGQAANLSASLIVTLEGRKKRMLTAAGPGGSPAAKGRGQR